MTALGRIVFALACAALSSCARQGVVYRGSEKPMIARSSELRELESMPDDYEKIGHVLARCKLIEGAHPDDGAPLSDVDCTETRLMSAIRERTAEVGGEVLVGRRCRSRVTSSDERSSELSVTCQADVARPTNVALGRRPLLTGVLGEDPDAPRVAESWNIRVHFAAAPGVHSRAPRRSDAVREVPTVPLSHVRLGDLMTTCERGCSREGARLGLLAAAGRFGATDVAEVHCARRGGGWTCMGQAAAYESDPELDPRAH